MKKLIFIFLIVALNFTVMGCAGGANGETDSYEPAVDEPEAVTEEALKVGLLLAGPISDMGWNTMGYKGLIRIEEEYDNVETSFVENVTQSDRAEVLRNFAVQGYDIIIGHGFGFSDPVNQIAPEYPDSQFVIIGGFAGANNASSMANDSVQMGFLTGIVAGYSTETNVVGAIGGLEIPPITQMVTGFAAGVKYVNPEATVLTALSGNMTDAHMAKEIGISMIENNADVLMGAADSASLGIVEAASEHGIRYIGTNMDMREAAPDTVIQSALSDGGRMYTRIIELYNDGQLGGTDFKVGITEGAVSLIGWDDRSLLTREQMDAIDEMVIKLTNGEIDHVSLASKIKI